MRLALAVALVAAGVPTAAAGLTACGGDTQGQGYEGCWRVADVALADCSLVRVSRDGGVYRVRIDYEPPRPAALVEGVLLVPAAPASPGAEDAPGAAVPGTAATAGALELQVRQGGVVLLRRDTASSPVEVALVALTAAAYEQELASMCDDRVRMEVMELASAVHAWAEGHSGRPPAVPLLAPDTEFARSLEALGRTWPGNPFTAAPKHAGSEPGDFAYDTAGRDFELTGYLSGGEVYVAE